MNSYNPFICNFELEVNKAKRMTIDQLKFAIVDCLECISIGCNPEKYIDQASVYRQELSKRVR